MKTARSQRLRIQPGSRTKAISPRIFGELRGGHPVCSVDRSIEKDQPSPAYRLRKQPCDPLSAAEALVKALVRHGADARVALTEVLGSPAEDIVWRETAADRLSLGPATPTQRAYNRLLSIDRQHSSIIRIG